MQTCTRLIAATLIGGALLTVAAALAPQQPDKTAAPAPPKTPEPPKAPAKDAAPKKDAAPADEMEAAMAAMQPGPMHAKLMKLAGEWTIETSLKMEGQEPMTSKGTAKIAPALGGRFLHETGAGEMMGMANEHFKQWGYNNGSKKYEAVWSWTMGTGFLSMNGESKDDGKTIEWKAWFDNEIGVREEFKCTTAITDDDHFSIKLYGGKMPDGSAGPEMTSVYTRKK